MRRHVLRHRKDDNEDELRGLLAELGVYTVKAGPLDFWAFLRGRWVPVEIKNPATGHGITPREAEFMADFDRIGAPYRVWSTAEQIVADANNPLT